MTPLAEDLKVYACWIVLAIFVCCRLNQDENCSALVRNHKITRHINVAMAKLREVTAVRLRDCKPVLGILGLPLVLQSLGPVEGDAEPRLPLLLPCALLCRLQSLLGL